MLAPVECDLLFASLSVAETQFDCLLSSAHEPDIPNSVNESLYKAHVKATEKIIPDLLSKL